jgi:hypothetical protein
MKPQRSAAYCVALVVLTAINRLLFWVAVGAGIGMIVWGGPGSN